VFEEYSDIGGVHKLVKKASAVEFANGPAEHMKVKIGIRVQSGQTAEIEATANGLPVEVAPEKLPPKPGLRYIAKEMADAFGGSIKEWLGFTMQFDPDYKDKFASDITLKPVESIPSHGFQVLTVVFAKYGDDLTLHVRLRGRKKGSGRKSG
jgi:hypothetical protein